MKLIKNSVSLIGLLLIGYAALAQSISVKGKVIEENGTAMPGVNILVKGTTTGTATDANGLYSIEVEKGATLVFSFIGYAAEEVLVQSQSVIDMQLMPDIQALSEVVVVGYGETKKQDLVSSVSSVTSKDITQFKTGNVATALQGRLAGVRVLQSSGGPGSQPNIYIRGISSVQGNTQPLLVVDGVPIYNGGLNSINPSDIDRIDVLKDASGAAIYGAKASNGVILITTKHGAKNTSKLDVDINYQLQSLTKPYTMANSREYIDMQRLTNPSFWKPTSPAAQDTTINTDWWGSVIRDSAPVLNANINYTGGNDKNTYSASFGYFKQDAQTQVGGWERVTARLNGDFNPTKWLRLGVTLAPRYETWKNFALNDFLGLLGTDPTTPIRRNLDHIPASDQATFNYDLDWSGWGYPYSRTSNNPTNYFLQMLLAQQSINRAYGMQSNVFIEVKPIDKIAVRSLLGANVDNQTSSSFSPKNYLAPNARQNDIAASSSASTQYNWSWTNTITYSDKFLDLHNVKVILGQEAQFIDGYYTSATRYANGKTNSNDPKFNFIDAIPPDATIITNYDPAGLGVGGANTDINRREAISSYFGRVEYNYASKYYLNANIRRDGNSKFPESDQFAIFPSTSVAWRITNESFMNGTKSWMDDLMLKVRWGQRGGSNIPVLARYDIGLNNWQYPFNGTTATGFGLWRSGNPKLKWEVNEDFSLGLDGSFFGGHLTANIEYFNNNSKDLLLNAPTQPSNGNQYEWGTSQWLNFGVLNNSGWEVSLNYNNRRGDFTYSAGANISHALSKVTQLYGLNSFIDGQGNAYREFERFGTTNRTFQNEPLGAFYGHQVAGIFQSQEDVLNWTNEFGDPLQTNVRPGDFKFVDVNKDGKVNGDDRKILGNPFPKIMLGLNFQLGYKDFDFTADFYGSFGHDIFNTTKRYLLLGDYSSNVEAGSINKVWTAERPSTVNPRPGSTTLGSSSYYIEDGSFLRARIMTLGYTVPVPAFFKGVQKVRVYAGAQNLFTITKYSGVNPEVQSYNQLQNGIDRGQYPVPRVYSFGINITLQ
jgi:TonB-dependent starch-binding outer membrane protein SusC